eukprot:1159846-Pelagomonas_calceolata.AAC.24
MVYERDEMSDRDVFVSYAICPLPTTAGMHHVSTRTWYPVEPGMAAPRNLFGMCWVHACVVCFSLGSFAVLDRGSGC